MSIHKIGSDLIRPQGPKQSRATATPERGALPAFAKADRSDRVEISPEGRQMAAAMAGESQAASGPNLAQIRERIDEGFYDTPTVAEEVAYRLAGSGDLDVVD